MISNWLSAALDTLGITATRTRITSAICLSSSNILSMKISAKWMDTMKEWKSGRGKWMSIYTEIPKRNRKRDIKVLYFILKLKTEAQDDLR